MDDLRRLVREALTPEKKNEATLADSAALSTSVDNCSYRTANSSHAPTRTHNLCWLCSADLRDAVSVVLPAIDQCKGPGHVLCDACVGLCYRTIFLAKECCEESRDARVATGATRTRVTKNISSVKGITSPIVNAHLVDLGHALAARVRALEPAVEAAALRAAPTCRLCRTNCAVSRHSPNGLPASVCSDGQLHVRWDCVYCAARHTRNSETCDGCGRSDGAHRWLCPGCLREGGFGLASASSGRAADGNEGAASGPGGRCDYCKQTFTAFWHTHEYDPLFASALLAPYEQQLRGESTSAEGGTANSIDSTQRQYKTGETLFPTLAHTLLGDASLSDQLRHTVANAMEDKSEHYGPYFELFVLHKSLMWVDATLPPTKHARVPKAERRLCRHEARGVFRRYVTSVRDGTHPGDELCLQVAARYFGVTLHLLTNDPSRWHVVITGSTPSLVRDSTKGRPTALGRLAYGRCYVRRWAPARGLSLKPTTDVNAPPDSSALDPTATPAAQGLSVELQQGSGQQQAFPKGVPIVLVDERPASIGVGRSADAPGRVHLFFHHETPFRLQTFRVRSDVADPESLVPSYMALLSLIAVELEGIAAEVRVETAAAAIRARRLAIPVRPPKAYPEGSTRETGGGETRVTEGLVTPPPKPPSTPPRRSPVSAPPPSSRAVQGTKAAASARASVPVSAATVTPPPARLPPARPPGSPARLRTVPVSPSASLTNAAAGVDCSPPGPPASRGPHSTFALQRSSHTGDRGEGTAENAPTVHGSPPLRPPRRCTQSSAPVVGK